MIRAYLTFYIMGIIKTYKNSTIKGIKDIQRI